MGLIIKSLASLVLLSGFFSKITCPYAHKISFSKKLDSLNLVLNHADDETASNGSDSDAISDVCEPGTSTAANQNTRISTTADEVAENHRLSIVCIQASILRGLDISHAVKLKVLNWARDVFGEDEYVSKITGSGLNFPNKDDFRFFLENSMHEYIRTDPEKRWNLFLAANGNFVDTGINDHLPKNSYLYAFQQFGLRKIDAVSLNKSSSEDGHSDLYLREPEAHGCNTRSGPPPPSPLVAESKIKTLSVSSLFDGMTICDIAHNSTSSDDSKSNSSSDDESDFSDGPSSDGLRRCKYDSRNREQYKEEEADTPRGRLGKLNISSSLRNQRSQSAPGSERGAFKREKKSSVSKCSTRSTSSVDLPGKRPPPLT